MQEQASDSQALRRLRDMDVVEIRAPLLALAPIEAHKPQQSIDVFGKEQVLTLGRLRQPGPPQVHPIEINVFAQ